MLNLSYSMLPKPTQERPIAKRFSRDIFPYSVGFCCKGNEKFVIVQEKSHISVIFLGVGCRV